jgi:hypothetical protein
MKDGSNLVVHLAPAPVVVRVATFTARIRVEALPWLRREVELVTYLASVGAAVMPPSDLVPPGPHEIGGWVMTAWQYVEHEPGIVPAADVSFAAIDELHAALRGYPGELPLLVPAADDLDRAIAFGVGEGLIERSRAADLRERRDRVLAEVLAGTTPPQALHGDAFPKNSLVTESGIVWIDLEDCCSGPLVWDLATWLRPVPDERIAAIVRRRHGSEALEAATVLRRLQEEVWNVLHDARIGGRLTRVRC